VSEYTFYIDLDGVLADFDYAVLKNFGIIRSQSTDEQVWASINSYDDAGGEWFYDLPVIPDAAVLLNQLKPYKPHILTATGRDYEKAAEQKRRWCVERIGIPLERIHTVRKSEDKAEFATPTSILIDDNLERSVQPFRAAGGISIHHTSALTTLQLLLQQNLIRPTMHLTMMMP
jgi:5'(3')-deoxyribonucleotidase